MHTWVITKYPCIHVMKKKTTFITSMANYCYRVMPFGLKSVGSTYQRLMDKIFGEHIKKSLEVYIDDMLMKTFKFERLILDLRAIFSCIRRHNIQLNLQKYAYTILGFILTYRDIEANLEKCKVILEMKNPTSVKEVQSLIGRLASLSRFLSSLAKKSLPLFTLVKKKQDFS